MNYSDFLDDETVIEMARSINGRAKALGLAGQISPEMLRDRVLDSGGHCEWCASSVLYQPIELDHVISLQAGGSNTPENLVVACVACNRAKSSKHPVRFAQETVARTGIRTPLIERLLAEQGVDAPVQRSFFDAPATDTPSQERPPQQTPLDNRPPYIWKR